MASEHSDILTENLVLRMVQQYKNAESFRHQNLIRDMGVLHGFDKKLAKLILEETNTPETDSLTGLPDLADPSGNDGLSGREARSASVSEGQGDVSPGPKPEKHRSWKKSFGKPS